MVSMYVYAIIPSGDKVIFDAAGVDDDHDEVYSVPYRDLGAVVSASSLVDYRRLKRDRAAHFLVAHQRVVEAAMQALPVLPVKFGTVLPDKASVRRLLAQGETLFHTTLKRFARLVQMEVIVLWNLQEVFKEISQEEPIARLKAQMAARPPDETMAERVAVGQLVQASLERRRAALRDRLLPPLREVASDLVINPLMDDSMVANMALLVDEKGRGDLDQRLGLLDKESGGRLLFRCVGPLPPYSFATVEVQVPSFRAVDIARRQLSLGETATLGEIRHAYYRLAGLLHPDHNPKEADAEAGMAGLTEAYRLLTAYAESQGPGAKNRQQASCRFDQQTVEQALLITIRRQEMPA